MRNLARQKVPVAAAVTVCSILSIPVTATAMICWPLIPSTLAQAASLGFLMLKAVPSAPMVTIASSTNIDTANNAARRRFEQQLDGKVVAATDCNHIEALQQVLREDRNFAVTSPMSTEVAPSASRVWWLLLPLLGMPLLLWLFCDRGNAPLAAAKPTPFCPRIMFTLHNQKDGYACWEIPAECQQDLRHADGQPLVLRLYDVTDIADMNRQMPHSVYEFSVIDGMQDRHVPIPMDNRDYLVELGYTTAEGQWLALARSARVQVPAYAVGDPHTGGRIVPGGSSIEPAIATPTPQSLTNPVLNRLGEGPSPRLMTVANATFPAARATNAAVSGAVMLAQSRTGDRRVRSMPDERAASRIILVLRSANDAYVYWEIDPADRAEVKQMGGRHMQLRVYEVMGIDRGETSVSSFQIYDVDELEQDRHVPIWVGDRHYIAEVGYITEHDQWLGIIRSAPNWVSAKST
ncbi:DUF4912 domain-containing protein [Leptolyngbya sp. AN02str]|uniref:DUF4912 domain-containing protein n=1 Tax=Leptolyngbya sp. AN02str TaxID=3423363 RepID=UPI003D313E92